MSKLAVNPDCPPVTDCPPVKECPALTANAKEIAKNLKNNDAFLRSSFMYGLKAVRVIIIFIATKLAANIFSQVYLDKVFVNKENPPHLINYVVLVGVLDLFMNVLVFLGLLLIQKFGIKGTDITTKYVMDYGISFLVSGVIQILIADVIMKKKYFLYKEDGLRAIFALEKISFNTASVIAMLPIYMAF